MENKKRTRCEIDSKKLKKREKDKRYYYKHRKEILLKMSIYQKERRKDIALTEHELKKMGRDKFGHFLITKGNTPYKRKQRNGRYTSEHVLIWEDYHKKRVPKGWVIHHINENKRDNRIENLKAMTVSEHTKMHFAKYFQNRDVWNKGLPKEQHPCYGRKYEFSEKAKMKQKCTWLNKNIDRNVEIWELRDNGYTPTQISKKLNLTTYQVNHGWKSISKIFDTSSGRLK